MNGFANKLTDLMKLHKTSQSQLAQILNVTQQAISRYMHGEREPDINTIIMIAKHFEISVDYLLCADD